MGWAKKNLSDQQRKDIAGGLFKITETSGDWLNGLCPLHGDTNQSFGYNFSEDVFHCHTSCTKDGDLVDLFCLVESLDPSKGFVEFKNRFSGQVSDNNKGGRKPPSRSKGKDGSAPPEAVDKPGGDLPPVDLQQMAAAYHGFPELPEAWQKRLEVMRGWNKAIIRAMGLKLQTHYRCKHTGTLKPVRDGLGRIVIPVFAGPDLTGECLNLRLYDPAATGKNKIISWGHGIGQNRLYPTPPPNATGLVWICEGESDTLCARSLGFEAYTQTAKRKKWPADQVAPFAGRDVVICYDADKPGQKYAESAAESLIEKASSVRIINWPEFMLVDGELAEKHGQDLSDFVVLHKKGRTDLEALLPTTTAIESLEDIRTDSFWEFFGTSVSGRDSYQPRLLAERLLKDNSLLFDAKPEILYRFDGRCYVPYQPASLKRQAIKYLGVESVRNRYEDAVGQAIILATMEEDRELDDKKGWICLDNGMFNIDTMETAPHGKHFLSTVQLPFSFDPDNPKPCPLWQKFLSETIQTENPIQQLQEFFGYCMTKEVRYETCLFMIGDGGDGKSTVQTLLRALCGKANCTSVPLDGLEDQFQRSALYKKLVNMSAEVGSNAMDSQFFKLIVSGDEISAAFKHKNTFDFEPFVKMVFAVNKMPKIMDNTDGFYRKILPISFKRQFLPGDPDRDPFLVDKLMEELPGIFGWAMAGLARLRQRGCFDVDCDETLQLVSEYRRQNSPIFAFVQDCLAIGETYTAGKEDLYKAYKAYCGENGYGASHRENFLADLRRTVKAVKNTRPRVNGERVQSLAGVGLVLKGSTL